jgi:hypothetical protein
LRENSIKNVFDFNGELNFMLGLIVAYIPKVMTLPPPPFLETPLRQVVFIGTSKIIGHKIDTAKPYQLYD